MQNVKIIHPLFNVSVDFVWQMTITEVRCLLGNSSHVTELGTKPSVVGNPFTNVMKVIQQKHANLLQQNVSAMRRKGESQ